MSWNLLWNVTIYFIIRFMFSKMLKISHNWFAHISEDIPNTISLHRKKQSNTLYTINALNEVIRELNNGILDKKFSIPWEDYQNSLLLTNDDGLNKIPTKIFKIINTKDWKKNCI